MIEAERTRPWTPTEVRAFVAQADQIAASLPLGHDHRALLIDLKAAAASRGVDHPDNTVGLGPEPTEGGARRDWRQAPCVLEQTQRRLGSSIERDREFGRDR
jgi:hypothetical protein